MNNYIVGCDQSTKNQHIREYIHTVHSEYTHLCYLELWFEKAVFCIVCFSTHNTVGIKGSFTFCRFIVRFIGGVYCGVYFAGWGTLHGNIMVPRPRRTCAVLGLFCLCQDNSNNTKSLLDLIVKMPHNIYEWILYMCFILMVNCLQYYTMVTLLAVMLASCVRTRGNIMK